MYDYIHKLVAPQVVEFQVRTLQGHRVVRVYLDLPTPRIMAFNESATHRSPAMLWLTEIEELIQTAKGIISK